MILNHLRALFGGRKTASAAGEDPAGASSGAARTAVFNILGRPVQATRRDWREKILEPDLRKHWNDPNALYSLIISALNDGFGADLLPAAQQLVDIDPLPERGHTVHALVLLENHRLDDAETTLRAGISKVGETGALLTNLAKVAAERGEARQARDLLWRALEHDPNLENSLMWWATMQRELHGPAAYLRALEAVADLPGSWRASLWLARHDLEHKDIEAARQRYERVLARESDSSSVLLMISNDLGRSEHPGLMLSLLAPVYRTGRHDPGIGINLLLACKQLGRLDQGESLLVRLYAEGLAPVKSKLDDFSLLFRQARAERRSPPPSEATIHTLILKQPIWHDGLRQADWLFHQKPEHAPQIGFFALSRIDTGLLGVEAQREDELGRLTRAIPLYLAEAAHYWTYYAAQTHIDVVDGDGPVVYGTERDGAELLDRVASPMSWLVTGQVSGASQAEGDGLKLTLNLWDCESRERVASESHSASLDGLGNVVRDVEYRLFAHLGMERDKPLDSFYQRPSPEGMSAYLVALDQAFMLTLSARAGRHDVSLWNERFMLDWPLNMDLNWRSVDVPKLIYLSGLAKARAYQSDVLPEYQARTLHLLFSAAQTNSRTARLAPLVWKIFNMKQELEDFQQKLPAHTDPVYRQWVDRVANA